MDLQILSRETFLVLLLAPFGFWFYSRLTLRLQRDGGAVRPEGLGPLDMLVSGMLASILATLAFLAFAQQSQTAKLAVTAEQLLANLLFPLMLVGGILFFFHARKVRLAGVMRPMPLPVTRAFGRGALLLFCALPVIGAFNLLVAYLLPRDLLQEQDMVTLFGNVSKAGNAQMILLIVVSAVVVAPICEEFIFRGYFYPVWKQYFGPVGSAVLASTLFALMHANLAALPGLFALALCFTVAFEASGSILVPMVMHALYNALTLAILYLRAQGAF